MVGIARRCEFAITVRPAVGLSRLVEGGSLRFQFSAPSVERPLDQQRIVHRRADGITALLLVKLGDYPFVGTIPD